PGPVATTMSGVPSAFTSPTATRAPVVSPLPNGASPPLRLPVDSSTIRTVGARPAPVPVTTAGAGTSNRGRANGTADVTATIAVPQTIDGPTFARVITGLLARNTTPLVQRAQSSAGTDHVRA